MTRRRRDFTGSPGVPTRRIVEYFGLRELGPDRTEAARRFPVRFTPHFLRLADPDDPSDPVRTMALPEARELRPTDGELPDPVGERQRNPVPYVVRKHPDRAIFLVTSRCHVYCRFCFRRSFPDGKHDDPRDGALDAALDYFAAETDLREVILSGGDPLTLPDETLGELVERLSRIPHLERLRIHTRAPVHDPARVTPELVAAIARGFPLWIVLHVNHPRELAPETRSAIERLRHAGLPLANQAVLLRGVNDNPTILAALGSALLREGVRPYYLHHPDRVPGTGGFWVTRERGLAIYRELARKVGGGLALPRYVVDLPDGSGKVPVESVTEPGSSAGSDRPSTPRA